MGRRIKLWGVMSRAMFLLVYAVSIGVFYLTKTGAGWTDFIINLVFALIAGLFLVVYFAGCAGPLTRTAAAIARVTGEIRGSRETPGELWGRYCRSEELFGRERLDERWASYLRQIRRLQRQNALTADVRISDYISEELLYSTVNKPFCDQLGGIMSGLGILFTFIGLVYGLRNFDATTVDVMQSSTQALMAGIKIAFLTSIFGLIYSLLFGITYKKLMKDSLEALYDFQDTFDECVRPVNEHAAENAMLRLQSEQNAALKSIGTDIGDQVGRAIVGLMQPATEELRRTITQYVAVAAEDQRVGMERVVRYFLDTMNSSLGGIFSQLKSRTEELTRWEKDMIDSISVLTAGMGRTAQDLAQAQESAAAIAATMAQYTETTERLISRQQEVIAQMRALLTDYRDQREQEREYLRALGEGTRAAAENTRETLRVTQTIAGTARGLQEAANGSARDINAAGKAIAQAGAGLRALSESAASDVNTAAARLSGAARDLDGSLSRAVGDSLALMDESIARLGESMNAAAAASAAINQSLRSVPRTVAAAEGDIRDTARDIDAELKLLLKAVADIQRSLSRFSAELARRADA